MLMNSSPFPKRPWCGVALGRIAVQSRRKAETASRHIMWVLVGKPD